jgi:hypothetical protein
MAGYTVQQPRGAIYDSVDSGQAPFVDIHHSTGTNADCIRINVAPRSYLKYVAMCISRTNGGDLVLEDLAKDTQDKLGSHPIMSFFWPDLCRIADGEINDRALRDWARLCFFDRDGATIQSWVKNSTQIIPRYEMDFESFYDGSVVDWCDHVLTDLGLDSDPSAAEPFMIHFRANNRYFSIDKPVEDMLQCIEAGESVPVPALNWLQQGYIDHWLQHRYNVDPLAIDQYWTHTQDLYHSYGLRAAIK